MYSCDDCSDLLHAFLTLTCPSAYYMLYCNISIYCNTLGAIYRYSKIQYRPSSSAQWICVVGEALIHVVDSQSALLAYVYLKYHYFDPL